MASPPLTSSVHRRRRRIALGGGLGVLVLLVVATLLLTGGGSGKPAAKREARAAPPPPPQLPRGGRTLLPHNRIVAYYGAPQDKELGELGIGSPATAARRLERQARGYARPGHPVLPAMELLAVVASYAPGPGDRYSTRQTDRVVRRYLREARRHKMLFILDIQPGRSDFFTETVRLRKWLKEPDVGLALDPEWRMSPGQIPGKVIGSVGSREVNATSAWLEQLAAKHNLPQKLFLIHQFTNDMVDDTQLKPRPHLAMVLNADGFGGQAIKKAKYHAFTRSPRKFFFEGFKLFYHEDTDLMKPRQVLRLRPSPDVIIYE